jgi:uncharacterized protein YqcC (DUF446 family)
VSAASSRQAASLILPLEQELRRLELWDEAAPLPAALQSPLPFCCDTLRLEQWLQWVFIPRIRVLIETAQPLPFSCGIHPMAEEVFRHANPSPSDLLALLLQFDELSTQR